MRLNNTIKRLNVSGIHSFCCRLFFLFLAFKGVALTFSLFWVKPKEHKNDLAPNV
jgi:hypothetical protein